MLGHTKTFMTITFEIGIRILCQNNKENVDFTESKRHLFPEHGI